MGARSKASGLPGPPFCLAWGLPCGRPVSPPWVSLGPLVGSRLPFTLGAARREPGGAGQSAVGCASSNPSRPALALPPASAPAEQLLLTKLKTECGYQFTSKLETMFGDIKLSRLAPVPRTGSACNKCRHRPALAAVCAAACSLPCCATVGLSRGPSFRTQHVCCPWPRQGEDGRLQGLPAAARHRACSGHVGAGVQGGWVGAAAGLWLCLFAASMHDCEHRLRLCTCVQQVGITQGMPAGRAGGMPGLRACAGPEVVPSCPAPLLRPQP